MVIPNSQESRMRLKRLARVGQILCFISIVLIVLFGPLAMIMDDIANGLLRDYVAISPTVPPSAIALIAAKFTLWISSLVFCTTLGFAWWLFRLVEKGSIYTANGQSCLRRLGWMALFAALSNCVARTLVTFFMSSSNLGNTRVLAISIGSNEILSVIGAVLFFIFARIMQEFAAMHEDNQSIV
jgi:Protein of unknown function (DUF2975)